MIPVCRPFTGDEECEAATRVIRSGWLSTGAEARAFEEELAARFNARVVGVSSASMGLQLSLAAHGIGPGDEVIVPAITFIATSNVVVHLGAKVVFADIDPCTGLMDFDDVQRRVSSKTRAIIPVDLYGQSVDLEPYLCLASKHKSAAIIEDAAQSFGTPGVGGRDGITTVFSFYATKNVAMGEGGAVVTTDDEIARKVRVLSQQGVTADAFSRYHGATNYDLIEIGYKGNLPDVLAAIGRAQLKKESLMQERRRAVCERYRAALPLRSIDWCRPTNYHLYPVFYRNRDRFRHELFQRGIGTGVHFECIPGLTAYRRMGFRLADTPRAARYGSEQFTLPTYAGLSDEDVEAVIQAVREVYLEGEA
jgi:dTDP-4-amino-4,6-dideoxygalactose transaminase